MIILYYIILYYIILYYIILYYVMLCYVMLCYVMLCYVMLCYVMLCYVMLCYVMLYYIILYYIISYHIILYYIIYFIESKLWVKTSVLQSHILTLFFLAFILFPFLACIHFVQISVIFMPASYEQEAYPQRFSSVLHFQIIQASSSEWSLRFLF